LRGRTFWVADCRVIYALYSISAPGFFILFSFGEAQTNAIATLSSGVVSLILILVGARYFGLLGALAGNAGYLGTLLMNVFGLRKVEVALRHYIGWMVVPLLGLVAALLAGYFCKTTSGGELASCLAGRRPLVLVSCAPTQRRVG